MSLTHSVRYQDGMTVPDHCETLIIDRKTATSLIQNRETIELTYDDTDVGGYPCYPGMYRLIAFQSFTGRNASSLPLVFATFEEIMP